MEESQVDKSPSVFQVATAYVESPFLFEINSPQWPTPKKWLQIFAYSFLWGLVFLVIRQAFLEFENESQILSAGYAAFLGFAATFVRLTAEHMIWTNYIDRVYDDQLRYKQ
tara:strand:+ start:491 stop:823 length:333 start_codon:yes stop_codon:yes gene_type:complete